MSIIYISSRPTNMVTSQTFHHGKYYLMSGVVQRVNKKGWNPLKEHYTRRDHAEWTPYTETNESFGAFPERVLELDCFSNSSNICTFEGQPLVNWFVMFKRVFIFTLMFWILFFTHIHQPTFRFMRVTSWSTNHNL